MKYNNLKYTNFKNSNKLSQLIMSLLNTNSLNQHNKTIYHTITIESQLQEPKIKLQIRILSY